MIVNSKNKVHEIVHYFWNGTRIKIAVKLFHRFLLFKCSEGAGARTLDLRIKSPLLYQLSYALGLD